MKPKSKSWGRILGEELVAFGKTGVDESRKMAESTASVGGQLLSGERRNVHIETRLDLLHLTVGQRKRHGR